VLLEFQGKDDVAVLNETCPKSMELAATAPGRVIKFGIARRWPFEIKVPGVHNQLNAQGAYAAAAALGVTWEDAQAALLAFRPLPHRLEMVHEENGVRYYNDSIATIPEAAIAALNAFPERRVIQIVGGYLKDEVDDLAAALAGRARVVLGIGEKGPKIAGKVREMARAGVPAVYDCGELGVAVARAKELAREGDVVLLSTGCKSYDQFVNFEQRGEAFTKLARRG
jgi:UDP-N-acetylmuramoylalanine--D-glutamate ligase